MTQLKGDINLFVIMTLYKQQLFSSFKHPCLNVFIASLLCMEGKQTIKSKAWAIKCCREIKITASPNEWGNIPLNFRFRKVHFWCEYVFAFKGMGQWLSCQKININQRKTFHFSLHKFLFPFPCISTVNIYLCRFANVRAKNSTLNITLFLTDENLM